MGHDKRGYSESVSWNSKKSYHGSSLNLPGSILLHILLPSARSKTSSCDIVVTEQSVKKNNMIGGRMMTYIVSPTIASPRFSDT